MRALFDPARMAVWRERLQAGGLARHGTTHLSVIDRRGNAVSASASSGAGSGYAIPGTGITMNNLLGGEDGSGPGGGRAWFVDERMASMMAPTVVLGPSGDIIVTGAGGSNRIWTAVLQILVNAVDFGMDLEEAVGSPRVHFEDDRLDVEGGFDPERIGSALASFPRHTLWPGRDAFFGGAHSARQVDGHFEGGGDDRRDGTCSAI
jgi:gamma-glutamyltranspeptidase/glutathione hydrolase